MSTRKNTKAILLSILVSVALYFSCSLLGSVINVLIALTAGTASFSEFQQKTDVAGAMLFLITTVANHLFFGWLTVICVRAIWKRTTETPYLTYLISAGSITVFVLLLYPVFFSSLPVLSLVLHVVSVLVFGLIVYYRDKKQPKQYTDSKNEKERVQSAEQSDSCICNNCGFRVDQDEVFCRKCGAKIKR